MQMSAVSILVACTLVLLPIAAMALALPIVTEVLPGKLASRDFHSQFWLVGAAFLVGLIAAPGYIRGLFSSRTEASPITRVWVLISLGLGASAAIVGSVFTYFFAWPLVVLPGGAAVACVCIWKRW